MLWSHLTVAARNLRRNAGYTAINVVGLGVGIAVSVLLLLFIRSEWAVNDAFPNAERIVRLDSEWADADRGLPFLTAAPAGETMHRPLPEDMTYHVRETRPPERREGPTTRSLWPRPAR